MFLPHRHCIATQHSMEMSSAFQKVVQSLVSPGWMLSGGRGTWTGEKVSSPATTLRLQNVLDEKKVSR